MNSRDLYYWISRPISITNFRSIAKVAAQAVISAMHAFPCGRIIYISIVCLLAIADAKSELAGEYVGPQGLVLEQVKPVLAPRASQEVFSLSFTRVLASGASWN